MGNEENTKTTQDSQSAVVVDGLESLHPMAYGLTREQHKLVVWHALNHYTEAYISNRYNISRDSVRKICNADGFMPERNEEINGKWENIPVKKLSPSRE